MMFKRNLIIEYKSMKHLIQKINSNDCLQIMFSFIKIKKDFKIN